MILEREPQRGHVTSVNEKVKNNQGSSLNISSVYGDNVNIFAATNYSEILKVNMQKNTQKNGE